MQFKNNLAIKSRLPAEWEKQNAVLLSWPHIKTKWAPYLENARKCISEIIMTILKFEDVILVVPDKKHAEQTRKLFTSKKLHIYIVPSDDIWARDFGPITVFRNGMRELLDFKFNGWGEKYLFQKDDKITAKLKKLGAFAKIPCRSVNFVLEGGSIESDGEGTILTTEKCLLNPNRNSKLSKKQIEDILMSTFGPGRILWLKHGKIKGDDTDSHIDTIARFAEKNTIIYMVCDKKTDPHYAELNKMEMELKSFKTISGKPYKLIPLPWPNPKFDEKGAKMPATYANFLVINGAVLVPTYRDKKDSVALKIIEGAFPRRKVIGIDCLQLIFQHGSLHCATMQIPAEIRKLKK